MQTISIPNQLIGGFDIDDGKIVWSDYRQTGLRLLIPERLILL